MDAYSNSNNSNRMWIILLKAGWWVITGLVILIFLEAIIEYYLKLNQVCLRPPCLEMQVNIGQAIILDLRGINISLYAGIITSIEVILYLTNLLIGIFIYVRKSNDWLAVFVSLMLITTLQADLRRSIILVHPVLFWPLTILGLLNSSLIIIFFFIFPTGSFRPRWTAVLAFVLIVFYLVFPVINGVSIVPQNWVSILATIILIVLGLCSLGVFVFRYRNIFNQTQRTQIRWVIYGVAVTWGGALVLVLLRELLPVINGNALLFISWNIVFLAWNLFLPVSILIAVLSAALLDIDILIRRTLAYTILTIILLFVYIITVLGLQKLFEVATGQSSPVIAIVSTLLIAALANPLRQRIQQNIDRIFYRERYSMELAVQSFSETVREDVDLDQISTLLSNTVKEALQPEFMSIWMCRVNPTLDVNREDQIR